MILEVNMKSCYDDLDTIIKDFKNGEYSKTDKIDSMIRDFMAGNRTGQNMSWLLRNTLLKMVMKSLNIS